MKRISNINPDRANNALSEYGGVSRTSNTRNLPTGRKKLGLFDSFVQKTALEAVEPYMHRWDAEDLMELYKKQLKVRDKDLYNQVYVSKTIAEIPENMVRDCFQNHFVNSREVSFHLNEYNQNSYEFSKNINDEYVQVITNNSIMNSFITTREIIYMLQKELQKQNQSPDNASGGEDPNSNQGKDNVAGACNKFLNSAKGQQEMNKAKNEAITKIQEAENGEEMADAVDQDEKDSGEGDDGSGGKNAGKGSQFQDLKKKFDMMDMVKHISLDSKALNEMVKESLNSTVNYFSANFKEFKESIITAENVNEIIGAEYASDELFMTHFEDIETTYRKYKLKLDVYIDISGSMDSRYTMNGKTLNCLDICKILAIKMKSKGILNNIHMFNTSILPRKNLKHMLDTNMSGGTDIDTVIKHVIETQIPSFIITDACDTIHYHTDKVYFLTVGGGSPSCGSPDIANLYNANGQGITYLTDNTFKKIKF